VLPDHFGVLDATISKRRIYPLADQLPDRLITFLTLPAANAAIRVRALFCK
jgi:hypothetical protein